MASRKRQSSPSVIETLQEKPYEYEFHQALRILERLDRKVTPLGEGLNPANENIELHSRVFLDWPPSDLFRLESAAERHHLQVNFFGLAGAQGPLPLPYTELILDRMKRKDRGFEAFLDVFNHRLLSILYRIQKKYWAGLDFKKPDQTKLSSSLFSLIGLYSETLRDRLKIPDRALLYYSGLLWQRPPSVKGCQQMLQHYFGVEVRLHPFKGRWRSMEPTQTTRLGFKGQMQVLGETAALGQKAWDPKGYVEIEMGPLTLPQFTRFLKTGDRYQALSDLLRFYLGSLREFRIRLRMKKNERPSLRLGKRSYLGWTTWITSQKPKTDDTQVMLYP